MKVKIGSFDEESATKLAKTLRSIGIGVEVRRYIDVDFYPAYFVEGKFSELRNKYEETELIDEIKRWKSYLELAKDVKNLDELEKKILEKFGENTLDAYATLGILYDMLELNGMIDGDKVKDPPEDPIIRFPYDIDDDKAKKLDLKQKLIVITEVLYDVFADLSDALLNEEKLVESCKEHDELSGLLMMAGFAESLLEKIGNKKVDIDEIAAKMRRVEFGESIEIRAPDVVTKAVMEALEKAKFVRIKRGKVSLLF